MHPSLKGFRKEYRELLLNLLWRQWSALGVAGHVRGEDSRVVDPEALLLLTCTLGRHEPRLFDEVLDWLQANGSFINIQRLKRIMSSEKFTGGRTLAAVAGLMSKGTDVLKWKSLAERMESADSPEAFFFTKDGKALPLLGKEDPQFALYGFQRGPLRLRGCSQVFRPIEQTNLLLQLRALFGINVRCEIILYLLTHEAAHPSRIAQEAYYFGRAVQNTLMEMTCSGIVQLRTQGREKHYWLKAEHWWTLLNRSEQPPKWITWPPLFSALEHIWLKLLDPKLMTLDLLLQSSEIRQLMVEIRPLIERAGFGKALSDDRHYPGEKYLPVFIADVTKLLGLS
jgi:hypothetical protein